MKLATVEVSNFQCIRQSNEIQIADITCLVGKNESGKTALLQVIYRLNPTIPEHGKFDVTDDYPRSDVEDYQQAVEAGKSTHAVVVTGSFTLSDQEVKPIEQELGRGILRSPTLVLRKGYDNKVVANLDTDEKVAVQSLVVAAQLPTPLIEELTSQSTLAGLFDECSNRSDPGEAEHLKRLKPPLEKIKSLGGLTSYIYESYLKALVPKFLYFDEYFLMRGHENIEALIDRVNKKSLQNSDYPLLGLIELARIQKLNELLTPARTEWLVNKLEGAGNHLTKKILKYWSQNKHLQMRFDVRPARPGDPKGMTSGNNIWARVYDSKRMVSTPLGTRSRGFVWFFSFLAWFDQQQRKGEPLILLLDEPGLFLHGRAQADMLSYIEKELQENYQVIYTTHSPFMVDPSKFERIRIVQDISMDMEVPLPPDQDGTKVFTDVLEATEDSLFPLQGALGYDIYQTLFIGPNNLVVEGVSDLLYLQAMSALLSSRGRTALSDRWTITPVGGADKVPTFISLLGAQRGMKIATLLDIQKKDQQTIENLYKRKLLKKQNVLTYADFTTDPESDVEDMLGPDFYLQLVNAEFGPHLPGPITSAQLKSKAPRILVKLEEHFSRNPLKDEVAFNHYRPARYLAENIGEIGKHIPSDVLDRFEKAFQALNNLL